MLFSRVQKSFTGMTVYLQVLQSTRAQRPAYRHLQGTLMTTVEGKCVHLRQRPAFHASVHYPDSAGGLQKCPPRLKKCFFCGSANVVWNGLRGRTQRYKCKGCGRRFDGGIRREHREKLLDEYIGRHYWHRHRRRNIRPPAAKDQARSEPLQRARSVLDFCLSITQNVQVTTFSVGGNDKSGWQIERLRA